jgi:hypothetical protein
VLAPTVKQIGGTEVQSFKVNVASHRAEDLGSVSGYPARAVWLEPGKKILFSRTVNGLMNLWTEDLSEQTFSQITFRPK